KRKTRASIAKEKGLEPLAKLLMSQKEPDVEKKATQFITEEVLEIEDALQGARDIVAEWISETGKARKQLRYLFEQWAIIKSKVIKGKEEEGDKYSDYFETNEPLSRCVSHRLLAIIRGEQEGFLRITIRPDQDKALEILNRNFVKGDNDVSHHVKQAVEDSYKRLIAPSLETESRNLAKEKADTEAIRVFAENLRQLLLAPPLGQKNVLAIDPGFRTGCKVVCLDKQGTLLHNENIYPHQPQKETKLAAKKIASLVNAYKIEAIAIGNGTAGRETEYFIKGLKLDRKVQVFVVSENGASVYSASTIAREEFPEFDVTVRGSVSIGRRLMDPLAELVKIDPKSIGVGQYQHDVDQGKLKDGLDRVVESCVNLVGVEVNTASKHLLTYVSGLGPQLAQNIVDYRTENGPYNTRSELKKVKRMGGKAYQQAAGFLRISNGQNPLDNTAVHPESYSVVELMARDQNCKVDELVADKERIFLIDLKKYLSEETGMPTLKDISEELLKPGRDPREIIKVFEFDSRVKNINDLQEGMILPGIVTNITNFGAFVDVGVKQDGLVHVSNLKNEFVKNPADVVKLHQHIKVKVLQVDETRNRIQLSMKDV
ncbi:MAG: RNA-binding transcriptional accessory protein, partial [Bacteroidales bacterium]|nr:RNA-binding transcriptional accessory protein [Bacteroidales bacterium]